MALVTARSVFLHIPKTCGQFIRNIFKLCKIPHEEIGDQHSFFPDLGRLQSLDFFRKRFIFAFVRHPLTWYQSRWAFRVKQGWKANHPLDYNCASNDFATFVENALRYKPSGWLSWECRVFINNCPKPIDFVGRTENLVADVIAALTLAGEHFNPDLVKSCPRINDSDMDGYPSSYWAKYSIDLAQRVLMVEQDVLNRYYHDYQIDPKILYNQHPR